MSKIALTKKEQEQPYPPQQRLNLLPFIRTGKRKAWLIVGITALVTLLYAYLDYSKNSSLKYSGSFQLLVEPLTSEAEPSDPRSLTNSPANPNGRLLPVDYPTILKILKSTDILSKITEIIQAEYDNFSLSKLTQNLQVERTSEGNNRFDVSKILLISYSGQDGKQVQLVLDTTAQEYLDYSLNSRKQEISKGLQFIDQQLPQLNQKVTRNLNDIQKLQEEYQIVKADTKGESLSEKVRETEFQQLETQRKIEEQTEIKNNLQSKLQISIDEAIAVSTLRENPNYQDLIKLLKNKERDLAIALATFNPNSPQVVKLQEEKQKILNLLDFETQQTISDQEISARVNRFLVSNDPNSLLLNLVGQLVEVANDLERLKARQQALARNASLFKEQAQRFPAISRRYKKLQQELNIANRTREQLLVQKDRLELQASQTYTPWKIISKPQIIRNRADDSRNGILKGLVVGVLIALGTAILIEKTSDIFYTIEDLADSSNLYPILAEIPFNPEWQKTKVQKSLLECLLNIGQIDHKHYDYYEFLNAFDKLYANIHFRYHNSSIRSVAICSPTQGDGKSTIALYLAKAIAATGKKVLLVDANSFSYQIPDKLISANKAEENLFVLCTSQKVLNNAVEREKMMNQFKAEYDFIIYDTPPLLDSVTAGFLSANTDGIVLVAAIGSTKKSLFIEALEQVKTFNLPLLGIVANHAGLGQLQDDKTYNFYDFDPIKFFKSPNKNNYLEPKRKS